MTSRLDRLFMLLENGATAATRQAAAVQIGEIFKLHPNELYNLLDRLHFYITSKSWETRIAASHAVSAIVNNLSDWDPITVQDEPMNIDDDSSGKVGCLSLESFNIHRVLENGSYLFAADESQFEVEDENSEMDPKERAAQQRLLVNQRLGLNIADALGINTTNLFSNADLTSESPAEKSKITADETSLVQLVQDELCQAGLKMSCRELNRAKRKAKIYNKQKSNDGSDKNNCDGSGRKKLKSTHSDADSDAGKIDVRRSSGAKDTDWPLLEFSEFLSRDLFSNSWETRHGSATALREIIKLQGHNGGKSRNQTTQQMQAAHLSWLEDKAIRLVCVLALDRFGDFLSDQVVAPVRETSAQVLGCIALHLPYKTLLSLVKLLHELLVWPHWGTRHGALLGLKYLLAVRADMRKDILKKSFNFIYKGLQDETDDVAAVAATCLVPVSEELLDCVCASTIGDLVATLWESLLEIDDLTASTNSILSLLSKLLSYPAVLNRSTDDLSQLIPRLWPFLYHSNATVRTSALNALETLLSNLAEQRRIFSSDLTMPSYEDEENNGPVVTPLKNNKNKKPVSPPPIAGQTPTPEAKIKTEPCEIIAVQVKEEPMEEPEVQLTSLKHAINEVDNESAADRQNVKLEINDEPLDAACGTATNPESVCSWLEEVLEAMLAHVFQRSLLESNPDIRLLLAKIWDLAIENCSLSHLLLVSCRYLPSWLCLFTTGAKVPLDGSLLILARHLPKIMNDTPRKIRQVSDLGESVGNAASVRYIGGLREGLQPEEIEERVVLSRCTVATLIGNLSHYVCQPMPGVEYKPDETPVLCYVRILLSYLQSRSGLMRYCAGLVARQWAIRHPTTVCHSLLKSSLLNCLIDTIYFEEITWMFTKLQQEARDFLALLKHYKVPFDSSICSRAVLSLEEIRSICESIQFDSAKLRKNLIETFSSRSKSILKNVAVTSTEQAKLSVTVQSAIAGALIRFRCLPEKLNPLIKPLMETMKREPIVQHQEMAAADLSFLLDLCVGREPNPSPKIIKNLATFLCADESFTPNVVDEKMFDLFDKILAVSTYIKPGLIGSARRDSGSETRRPGRPSKSAPSTSSDKSETSPEDVKEIEAKMQLSIQRRGCTISLTRIARDFGENLGANLPWFTDLVFGHLEKPPQHLFDDGVSLDGVQELINWLQLLEIVVPALHTVYLNKFIPLMGNLTKCLGHRYSGVRHMASRAVASLASARSVAARVLGHVLDEVVPGFDRTDSDRCRAGALECVHLTVEKLGFDVIPFIVLLIVPLLGRMSDPIECIRHLATQCFASLIRLYPLDGEYARSSGIVDARLSARIVSERAFIEQLLDPKKIDNYEIPVPIKAELRPYQQNGVNWLGFLNRYKLHGILCDDMGLGKTLQSICILASDHFYKDRQLKDQDVRSCRSGCQSLVVCPPTLTGHWYYEVTRFAAKQHLDPLHYTGPPLERKRMRSLFWNHNLIIASYKIVRNEIDFFSKIRWNYIILDEGHIIKNSKTKSTKAIKELMGQHRVILSGTPIQNNVLELWSLFDFLMPGFLGTERQFISKYSKPILLSKEAKSSSREQEAGVLALEALHRQVLPFLLRRIKEDVLQDLPPKITQDYYCELTPLQERLYEDFTKSRKLADLGEADSAAGKPSPKDHVFQALQYLRRVCNHPKLVLTPSHPQFHAILSYVQQNKVSLDDIEQSAKLPALKQLLLDCGIGCSEDSSNVLNPNSVVAPHRALIFCQLKGMLDIIEQDLLKRHLPTVSYLRLDGSVPAGDRHGLVQKFNSDPSIDILLLTTHVGGLGLNLTGADMVIFVEHDWNPMRDLQAMDRAHRIGQKRVVNVYRLITKATLEEKIMSLQKFKLMTANCVIGQENSSLLSMGTEQLLDLFVLDKKMSGGEPSSSTNGNEMVGIQSPGFKKALENLPALWEENAYDEEYNIDAFLKKLQS